MFVLAPNQIVEKFPYSIGELRKDNPDTSFPRNPGADLLAAWNVFPVVQTEAEYDPATQVAIQEGCFYNQDGERWETSWIIRDKTRAELELEAQKMAKRVRADRDRMLKDTDWLVIKALESGSPLDPAWAIYRQDLRDITKQSGFPAEVTWPIQPF